MKRITYICDKCKKEFDRKNIVQIAIQKVNCGDAPQKASNEFCVPCYNGLMTMYDTYVNFKDPVVEKTDMEGPKSTEEVKVNSATVKTGAMTPSEISIIMRMDAEGKSPEEIAKAIHRTVRGVNRSITTHKNKMVTKEEVSDIKESDVSEGKKIDVSGIIALAKAGWTPRQIAGEHDITAEEVSEILSEYRKKS